MPIIPVIKIPVSAEFAPYVIHQDLEEIFLGNGVRTEQPIPIYPISEDATVLGRLNLHIDLVQYPIPSDGILSNFRYFQIENQPNQIFDINFINATQTTSTTVLQPTGATNTLFTNNTLTIPVNKNDLVNWLIKFPSRVTGTVAMDILAFTFTPTGV